MKRYTIKRGVCAVCGCICGIEGISMYVGTEDDRSKIWVDCHYRCQPKFVEQIRSESVHDWDDYMTHWVGRI